MSILCFNNNLNLPLFSHSLQTMLLKTGFLAVQVYSSLADNSSASENQFCFSVQTCVHFVQLRACTMFPNYPRL